MAAKAKTVNAYLALQSADTRAALKHLRRAIKAAAPKAEECISYGIPAFTLDGRILAWYGAAANHCSFFPGAAPIKALASELKAYRTSKGTVRFAPERPLPVTLVKKLVKARIAEHAERRRGIASRRP